MGRINHAVGVVGIGVVDREFVAVRFVGRLVAELRCGWLAWMGGCLCPKAPTVVRCLQAERVPPMRVRRGDLVMRTHVACGDHNLWKGLSP